MSTNIPEVQPGDLLSASHVNQLVGHANRPIIAPNAADTPSGLAFVGGGVSAVSVLRLGVLRELNLGTPLATLQEVTYDPNTEASKLAGETDFYHHVTATGAVFEVIPPPTFTYGIFNVMSGAALRPVAEIVPPENLSAAILWWWIQATPKPWAWMAFKPEPGMAVVLVDAP